MPLVNPEIVTPPTPPVLTAEQEVRVKARSLRQLLKRHRQNLSRLFDEVNGALKFKNAAQKTEVLASFGADGPSVLTYRNKLRLAVETLDGRARTEQ